MIRRLGVRTPLSFRTLRALLVFAVATAAMVTAVPASATTTSLAVPASVRALAAGSGKAVVSWAGLYGAAHYRIRYGTTKTLATSGPDWTDTTAAETHVVLTGLAAAKTYYVRVRSLAAAGSTIYTNGPYSSLVSFTTSKAGLNDFGVMSYNMLCADYCVESTRHNIDTFPWLKRRAALVNDIKTSRLVDIIGLQEAGGYVATGWNCRYYSAVACATPAKFAPDGIHGAYDRFCSVADCPNRVPGGIFGETPRQIDDVMRFLPDFGITDIAGDPNAPETGFSYLRIMWRTSTFDLVQQGSTFDIDGDPYEATVNWHRKAYWAILQQKSTAQKYFVVTAHPVSTGGVTEAEGYPAGANASDVRAAGSRKMVATIDSLNIGNLPVIITADMNTSSTTDGSLTVMKDAGYVDTRAAASTSQRINDTVRSYNGFNPANAVSSGVFPPLDHVFVKKAGRTISTGLAWLEARVRGSYVYNCRTTADGLKTPPAGCWGSDHFPLVAQLWQVP